MGRWLGIDHGTKRIGIAAGSTADCIASPISVIPAKPHEAAIKQIKDLAEQYEVEGIVVGWPLNMDDSEGLQAKLARRVANELAEATGLDVRLWDERLSSFAADQMLSEMPGNAGKKGPQDAIAAATILHEFLSTDGVKSAIRPDEVKD